MAFSRRVPNVSLQAGALGHVVEHIADGIDAAGSGTGVLALGINAGQAGRAVRVQDTLGSAGQVRVTLESGQTLASGRSAQLRALGIVSAGAGVARADDWLGSGGCCKGD